MGTIGERLGSDCGANMKEGSGSDLGLRLQGHPNGSSASTIFEDLFTEEGTGA